MRVAFDIGGTFTDVIILANDRRIHTAKVLSLLDRSVKILSTASGVTSPESRCRISFTPPLSLQTQ